MICLNVSFDCSTIRAKSVGKCGYSKIKINCLGTSRRVAAGDGVRAHRGQGHGPHLNDLLLHKCEEEQAPEADFVHCAGAWIEGRWGKDTVHCGSVG